MADRSSGSKGERQYSPNESSQRIRRGLWIPLICFFGIAFVVFGVSNHAPTRPFFEDRALFDSLIEPLRDPAHSSLPVGAWPETDSLVPKHITKLLEEGDSQFLFLVGSDFFVGAGEIHTLDRVRWDPKSGQLAILGSPDENTRSLHISTGARYEHWQRLLPPGLPVTARGNFRTAEINGNKLRSRASAITFHPHGREIAIGYEDGGIEVFSWPNLESLNFERSSDSRIIKLAYGRSGHLIVGQRGDGSVVIWRNRPEGTANDMSGPLTAPGSFSLLRASRDGRRMLYSDGSKLQVLTFEDESYQSTPLSEDLPAGSMQAKAISDDGRYALLLTPIENEPKGSIEAPLAMIWDFQQGQAITETISDFFLNQIRLATFSPDGRFIAAASNRGEVRIYPIDDLLNHDMQMVLGNETRIDSLVFAPGGDRLVIGAGDSAGMFSLADGSLIGQAQVSGGFAEASFSPDGRLFSLASSSGHWLFGAESLGPIANGLLYTGKGDAPLVAFDPYAPRLAQISRGSILSALELQGSAMAPVQLRDAAFSLEGDGLWVVGDGEYLARLDTTTWEWFRLSSDGQEDFHRAAFATQLEGMILSKNGNLRRTDDGGATWSTPTPPTSAGPVISVLALAPGHYWTGHSTGEIYESRDGAQSWTGPLHRGPGPVTEFFLSDDRAHAWALFSPTGQSQEVAERPNPLGAGEWKHIGHYPAPFWLGVALVVLLFALVAPPLWRRFVASRRETEVRVLANGAADRPLSWSDPDPLGYKPIAAGLSTLLRNQDTEPPLTIAVTGTWGSGKSSMMNLLKEDLERFNAHPVWFNAWHHREEEHLLAALSENLRRQALPPWWSVHGWSFRAKLFAIRARRRFDGLPALTAYSVLAYFVALATGIVSFEPGLFKEALSVSPLVLIFPWLRQGLTALPSDSVKLLASLSHQSTLNDFRDKLSFRYRFGEEFDDICRALRGRNSPGLVIVIDDLDRCLPDHLLQVMETINYLVSAGPCFIVLGMDRRQVEHAIGNGFKEIVEGLPDDDIQFADINPSDDHAKQRAFARHYLEKLINVEVPLPRLDPDEAAKLFDSEDQGSALPPLWYRALKKTCFTAIEALPALVLVGSLVLAASWINGPQPETTAQNQSKQVDPAGRPESGTDIALNDETADPGNNAVSTSNTDEAINFDLEAAVGPQSLINLLPSADRQANQLTPTPVTGLSGWLPQIIGWGLLGAILLVVALQLRLWLRGFFDLGAPVIKDSDDFKRALQILSPLVQARHPTPRALKRFRNRMRFLAGRDQATEPEIDWFDRRFKPQRQDSAQQNVKARHFNAKEPLLVLLGAIDSFSASAFTAEPRQLIQQFGKRLKAQKDGSERSKQQDETWTKVWQKFNSSFSGQRPSAADVSHYLELTGAVERSEPVPNVAPEPAASAPVAADDATDTAKD